MPRENNVDKILKALQDLYRSNSEILDGLDTLNNNFIELSDRFKKLEKYYESLRTFENKVVKNWLYDSPPPPKGMG